MRFGKTLRNNTLKEWAFYTVDYKKLKQALNGNTTVDNDEFFNILSASEETLCKFYEDKEQWATQYVGTLEERVENLRQAAEQQVTSSDSSDASLYEEEKKDSMDEDENLLGFNSKSTRMVRRNVEVLKEEYRNFAKSQHFHHYIYAKKSLDTFLRELNLLIEFLDLNKMAFSKILKKFDKVTGSCIREEQMNEIFERNSYLEGDALRELKGQVKDMLHDTEENKPCLPDGWGDRKVYTIGCFDLFHRGHQNVLKSLREFGYFIVAGIHDDESYFKLKKKYPIDSLETRMKNVKPFVDQIYVIPSTDPLLYIKSMVSEQDIESGQCCYARGDDMLEFPGRPWVESVMPVHFVPRTEACSSTLIRTIYHDSDSNLRAKLAFAKTRYDGKPVDANGDVIKITPMTSQRSS
eukprot:CAMPEP_0195530970 /NCGR_PEP_ID=MMETSP0794_2-20130614/34090_1 /TAXON_ID=515487 /ORGANISM="Stephanopyxis turris, Strain CCMP 815" /LENGTH=407 /DNA_ID=CAMNT_0040662599 /DNA_START=73 /DNA_END=1296 /DNA_ORIENTATION=+